MTDKGIVLSAEKFGWRDYDLRSAVEQATGISTHVLNDADCAILAEHTFGQGSGHMILLRLGRGVGCGVITHNTLVRGAGFAAGELGHVRLHAQDTAECGCGNIGCLETCISLPAIWKALSRTAERPAGPAGRGLPCQRCRSAVVGLGHTQCHFHRPRDVVDQALAQALHKALALRSHTARASDFRLVLSEDPEYLVLRGSAVNVLFHELGIA